MSEENAIPEAPEAQESIAATVASPVPMESIPSTDLALELPNAEPAAPASVVESAPVPLTEAESIAALSVEVATTLHDVFQYIHQGFDQHSLMIGMSRFYEIARAVKARAES